MSSIAYRPDIDGLRAVAVLSVVVSHAVPGRLTGGFAGVDVFFVISGYLITLILVKEWNEGAFSFAAFYRRRIRRLFPALVLVLATSLAAGWFLLLADGFAELARQAASGAAFVANLYFWREVGYFDAAAAEKPLLHLWSLGVEEQFYLLWPLLLWLCLRRRASLGAVLAVLTLASFAASAYLTWRDPAAAFYSPVTRLWQLGAGGLLSQLGKAKPTPGAASALSIAGLALILVSLILISEESAFPGWWAAAPVGGTLMVIGAGPEALGNRVLALRPVVWIGLISYPLYLWHWPLLSFALIENHLEIPTFRVRLTLMLLAALLALCSYLVVERPLRKASAGLLAGAMTTVFAASVAIAALGGLPQRAVNQDPRKRFVAYYADLHRNGLRFAYREECDFLRWERLSAKESIDPACTRPGAKGTYLLVGDSHAQALSLGIRRALPPGYALAQVTTSGCWAFVDPDAGAPLEIADPRARACRRSNAFTLTTIARLHPLALIVAQSGGHDERDWAALATTAMKLGAGKLVLVGPVPQWHPSLPLVVAAHHWPMRDAYVATGLSPLPFRSDAILKRRYTGSPEVQYVSLTDLLCRPRRCRARIDRQLTAVDRGHLSPEGSLYVGRYIVAQMMAPHAAARQP